MFDRIRRRFSAPQPAPVAPPEPAPSPLAGGEDAAGAAAAVPAQSEPQARESKGAPRRQFTPEERAQHIADFRASGLSARAFAERAGLNPTTFTSWVRVQRRKAKVDPRYSKRFSPDERRAAVEAFMKSGRNRVDFARLWGCSPSSLDKWLKRYRDEGPKGLETRVVQRRPRRPHPKRLPDSVRDLIVEVRREHDDFGVTRIADHLKRFHSVQISPSGVRNILRERGVPCQPGPKRRPRPKSKLPRRFERARPGELWQSDITSFVLRRQGRRVYLTVFLDDHSRYVVAWALATHQRTPLVTEALLEGIARFGKPKEVLTDQGRQYFAWRGKSAFQKLLAREGIAHVVSRTHHPETLGKCERLWKTVGNEFWDRAGPQDLDDARRRIDHWFRHYNHFRPHQGIDGLVPADRFFGAEDAVREALEKGLSENELRRALDEAPRQGVYLVGQIGSQCISLRGERGKLLIDTPDGGRKELSMNELGIERKEDGTQEHSDDEQPGDGNGRIQPRDDTQSGNGTAATHAQGPQADGLQQGTAPSLAGARPVGECAAGGEGASAQDVYADPRVLAGEEGQEPGGYRAGGDGAARLAAQPAGALGDDGGTLDAATDAGERGSLRAPDRGDASGAQEAHRGAGEGAGTDRGPGARTANSPVGELELGLSSERREESCQEGQIQRDEEESPEKSGCESERSCGVVPTRRGNWLHWLSRKR